MERTEGRLFISYATDDKVRVQEYCRELAKQGVSVWLDQNDIDPSDDLVRRINDGIAGSRYALLFYSSRYAAKPWTSAEHDAIMHAAVVSRDRKVFVVRLDETELPPLLTGKLYFAGSIPVKEVARRIVGVIGHDAPLSVTAHPPVAHAPLSSEIPLTRLDDISVEALAELLQTGGIGRATRPSSPVPELDGYLHGVGSVRIVLRQSAVTQDRFRDFESVAKIAGTHRKFIAHLQHQLVKGGLGVHEPAWLIEVEDRTKLLADTRHQLREFLKGFVLRIEVVEAVV